MSAHLHIFVYAGAELQEGETPSFWKPSARVIATGSLSKAYGLPGLRIGWALAPTELSERMWARKDYTTISPGQLTDGLATLALGPAVRPRLLQRTRRFMRNGLAALEEWFAQTGIFRYQRPAAGAIVFARYDLPVNSSELAERLRSEHSVLIVPGDHFRLDSFLRFGFGQPVPVLQSALQRISVCISSLETTAR